MGRQCGEDVRGQCLLNRQLIGGAVYPIDLENIRVPIVEENASSPRPGTELLVIPGSGSFIRSHLLASHKDRVVFGRPQDQVHPVVPIGSPAPTVAFTAALTCTGVSRLQGVDVD
jgi:hypothetical protein